jgi:hypothetical protein
MMEAADNYTIFQKVEEQGHLVHNHLDYSALYFFLSDGSPHYLEVQGCPNHFPAVEWATAAWERGGAGFL